MPSRGIVQGQDVQMGKLEAAIRLRRRMTPQERTLWNCLRANRLDGMHFRRQQVIDGLIVDFYCNTAALVVEVDGKVHENQMEYDRERDKVFQQRGLRVLHITNDRVERDLAGLLTEIRSACRREESEART
jgi:very-short-patch-repair endonuclease